MQTNITTTDRNLAYQQGYLPQRNNKDYFYRDNSSRSNLTMFALSSENRRIQRKTENFQFEIVDLKDFNFNLDTQKLLFQWLKGLEWDFPISSVKYLFTSHIFNRLYIWKDSLSQVCGYSICLFEDNFSHIAYIFYDPKYKKDSLSIRMVLQVVIDSHQQQLEYCYLGNYAPPYGAYKRDLPGFEYYNLDHWQQI